MPFRLKTFRGCVTSGKRWVFFVYNAENPKHGQGKTVYWLEAILLGDGLQNPTVNLELILGILRDWVSDSKPMFDVYCVRLNTVMTTTYTFSNTHNSSTRMSHHHSDVTISGFKLIDDRFILGSQNPCKQGDYEVDADFISKASRNHISL